MDFTILIQGITIGSIYALAGVSINIIYRPTNVFNIAQGNLVMLGAIVCSSLLAKFGLPWYLAALASLVLGAALSFLTDVVAVAPLMGRRGGAGHGWVVSTLAVSMVIEDLVGKLVGPDPKPLPPPPPFSTHALVAGQHVSTYQIFLVILVLVLVVMAERFYRTRAGKAMLAISEDREASLLRGIDPRRLAALSFAIGGGVAAVAGVLAGPILFASISMGAMMLIKGFEAAALGGIGYNRGAIVGGYLLGLVEVVASTFLSPGYQDAASFVTMLLVLLVRPQGVFGRATLRAV